MSQLQANFQVEFPSFTLDVNFTIPLQGVTTVFGPSGCGKTTLLRCIAGLERAPQGFMKVGEHIWQEEQQQIFLPISKRAIGYVFQEPRLFPHLTVRSNLTYGFKRTPSNTRHIDLDHIIAVLGIEHLLDRHPQHLSGGEQQRVAIGRALLRSPQLLLMDEPLSSLDLQRKREILPFIQRLDTEFHVPILYVTHDIQEVVQLSRTVLLLNSGKIVSHGTIGEVFSQLNLRQVIPENERGAIIDTQVAQHDEDYGLTQLQFAGGRLSVPRQPQKIGEPVRVQILAKDVSIVASHPSFQTSVLNVLKARITEIGPEDSVHPFVDLKLDVGVPLLATITTQVIVGTRPQDGARSLCPNQKPFP